MALGHANAMLWSIGNALTAGPLLYYLAQDLGAQGKAIGYILAAPSLAGVLRIFAPWIIQRLGGVKRACLITFIASYLLLVGQPLLAMPGPWLRHINLTGLITLICFHQLLEYLGQAALWAWFGEVVPRRIRGRYFARRQIWQLAVMIPTIFASGWFTDLWRETYKETNPQWLTAGYAICSALGVLFLILSLIPLWGMPYSKPSSPQSPQVVRSSILAPWHDARFLQLLRYGCWVAMANGLTQSAQNIYPKAVLGLGLFQLAAMRTSMRIGQIGFAQWAGPFSDRHGNRPVLVISQLFVSLSPIFFLLASPTFWWPLAGAWLLWSAFAGLNICLPAFMLKVARKEDHAAYVATYFGVSSAVYACASIGGGYLHDWLHAPQRVGEFAQLGFDAYQLQFALGTVLRLIGVWWLIRLIEPNASRWIDLLGLRRFHRKGE